MKDIDDDPSYDDALRDYHDWGNDRCMESQAHQVLCMRLYMIFIGTDQTDHYVEKTSKR